MAEIARDDRWRMPPLLGDVLLGALMTAVCVGGSIGESHPLQASDRFSNGHLTPVAPWPAYLLVAAAAVALIWRRHRPVAVLVVSLAGVLAYTALGLVNGAALLAPAVAVYEVARRYPVRQAVGLAAAALVLLGTATAVFNPLGTFGGPFPVLPGVIAIAVLGGLAVANRQAYVAALAQRAELAEHTREDEARRRVDAERLRIARELHDVVAHTMATINVQAGAAAHVIPDLPEPAATALRAIKDASKQGLRELRAILAVLRQADEAEPTQPAAGLAALDALVATVSAAGLPTEVHTSGALRSLPVPVDLAAYRIIQESLTNAIRHASPATATIRLDVTDGLLSIEVTDTGPGTTSAQFDASQGHGLLGMRERATALGGTLDAGPGPAGGFQVLARLPTGTP